MATDALITERPPSISAAHTLDAVRRMAPTIAERAAEVEAARRLPADLLQQLIDIGCFRMLLPASHGGASAPFPETLPALEALARADGSVGWTVMIGAGSWIDLAHLSRASFDALYADGPDAILAGAFNPSGSVSAVDGGYQVEGRWAFASGCEHARWIWGNCMEMTDEGPQLRGAVFAPDEVQIEDTWNVSGLRGTGSHHFSASLVVPPERTWLMMAGEPCIDDVIARVPPPSLFALAIATVAVGIAQGALDDIMAIAHGKMPLLSPTTLAANPHFQYELAQAEAELRAARSLVQEDAQEMWAAGEQGVELTLEQLARIRSTAVWAVGRSVDVVDTAYRAGGGTAVYNESPLQRRLRDIHTLTQHFLVKPDTFTTAGAILAGQEPELMVF